VDAAWIAEGCSIVGGEGWLLFRVVHAFFGGWLAHAGLVVDDRQWFDSIWIL